MLVQEQRKINAMKSEMRPCSQNIVMLCKCKEGEIVYSTHTDEGLMLKISALWSFFSDNSTPANLLGTKF